MGIKRISSRPGLPAGLPFSLGCGTNGACFISGQLGASHPAFWLKLESLQATGAFKARGALNNLLAADIPAVGVCAASGGNHGQAVAWAARLLGARASVFVPTTCPPVKLRRLAGYGAWPATAPSSTSRATSTRKAAPAPSTPPPRPVRSWCTRSTGR